MSDPDDRALISASPPPSTAVLLCGEQPTAEERNLTRILEFFAIPWRAMMVGDRDMEEHRGRYAIVSSARCMAKAMGDAECPGAALPPWLAKASTVYVYGFQDNDWSTKLLRHLTGDPQAKVRRIHSPETVITIAADSPEICGPMSGMRLPIMQSSLGCVCHVGPGGGAFRSVVRANDGQVFFEVACAGVRFYLNSWERTIDIGTLSPKYFDVKEFFCEAVPLIFYLRWAFPDGAWGWGGTNACLVVDDPPLKRRYGFLDFREALDLMDRHNFATTVAFIPWNWRRTNPSTLSLFQRRPERLSLVFHGCDHTAGEFAVRSPALLNRKTRTSRQRMECFRRRTSIKADRVMVFPQGRFSPEIGRVLKLNGFLAAVNTEVAPAQPAANETRISDLWNVAITRYGTFPIFTRRYAGHGIENFAFDALLGKPCLITAHHDVFRDQGRNLVDLVSRLNSLRWNLVWRPLAEAIRRSFTIRHLYNGMRVIQMFSSSLVVDNPGAEAVKALLLKEEGDPNCIQAVSVNQKRAEFSSENGYLRTWLTIPPGETALVRVVYRNVLKAIPDRESFGTNVRVAVKRYLSEFRDNYLSRSDFLYESANRLKDLMK